MADRRESRLQISQWSLNDLKFRGHMIVDAGAQTLIAGAVVVASTYEKLNVYNAKLFSDKIQ